MAPASKKASDQKAGVEPAPAAGEGPSLVSVIDDLKAVIDNHSKLIDNPPLKGRKATRACKACSEHSRPFLGWHTKGELRDDK